MLLQGVREVFELSDPTESAKSGRSGAGGEEGGVEARGKIVVIGRGLDGAAWQRSLSSMLQGELSS